jgi:hydrogenase maturation protease
VKTIVIGLGNPILGDDGVGWQIASKLQQMEKIPLNVTIDCLAIGGFSLMEALIGYDRAILIDAIVTHKDPVGRVRLYKLEDLPNPASGHTTSAHDTSLQNALIIGRSLGVHLPSDISIVTVEAEKVYDFSEELTPPVASAVPEAVDKILSLLMEYAQEKAATGGNKNN